MRVRVYTYMHIHTHTHTAYCVATKFRSQAYTALISPGCVLSKTIRFSLAIIQRWSYHAVHVESDYLSFPREPYSDGYTLLITWKSGMPLALGASVLICTTFHFLVILQRWLYHAGRISILLVQTISV